MLQTPVLDLGLIFALSERYLLKACESVKLGKVFASQNWQTFFVLTTLPPSKVSVTILFSLFVEELSSLPKEGIFGSFILVLIATALDYTVGKFKTQMSKLLDDKFRTGDHLDYPDPLF